MRDGWKVVGWDCNEMLIYPRNSLLGTSVRKSLDD